MTGAGVRNLAEIERALTEFAREPGGGLIVAPAPPTFDNRSQIVAIGREASPACGLLVPLLCHQRRLDRVWYRWEGAVAGSRVLC